MGSDASCAANTSREEISTEWYCFRPAITERKENEVNKPPIFAIE